MTRHTRSLTALISAAVLAAGFWVVSGPSTAATNEILFVSSTQATGANYHPTFDVVLPAFDLLSDVRQAPNAEPRLGLGGRTPRATKRTMLALTSTHGTRRDGYMNWRSVRTERNI